MIHMAEIPVTAAGKMVTDIIRSRRSIHADEFTGETIPEALLHEILTNATWAPTHKMTEPWRFVALQGSHLQKFGRHLAAYYKEYYRQKMSPQQFQEKYNYLLKYPLQAGCMIAVILVRSEHIAIPAWEEIAAVASAVQNMALTCTACGLGSYWNSSDGAISYVSSLGLKANEQSLGLFFIGYPDGELPAIRERRSPLTEKITFLY